MNTLISLAQPKDKARRAMKHWQEVKRAGRSRQTMVNYITSIGGYSDRHERYAIEFCIKDYDSDTSVENLWKLLLSDRMDVGPAKDLPPEHVARAKALFWRVYAEHEGSIYEWGREEAYEGWSESDSPFETFHGQRVEWRWVVLGRGGGHLCMSECEGIDLRCNSDDLEQRLMEGDDGGEQHIPLESIKKLFIICVQNSCELTSEAIGAEVNYRAAWRLWVSFCEDELAAEIKEYEAREALSEPAGLILQLIRDTVGVELEAEFITICKLADVKPEGE